MFCRAMEIGLLGSRIAYALKEPYILVYIADCDYDEDDGRCCMGILKAHL